MKHFSHQILISYIQLNIFYQQKFIINSMNNVKEVQVRGIKMKRKPMFDESGTTLLNGIKLNFEKGFGYDQDPTLKSNAYCIDDNRIIYVLSKQIVLYDLLAETQKVIDSIDFDEKITALLYFKNILLEDNIIYVVQNFNKSFPCVVIHNFSKNFVNKLMLGSLDKDEKILQLSLINDYRNIAVLSAMDKVIKLTIVQIASKEGKMFQYLNFLPLGIHGPSQFPSTIILYTEKQIYLTDIESNLKIQSLNMKKILAEGEQIVQTATSLHMNFSIYAITNKGYLYFIYIDIKQQKITKVNKEFLGYYQTIDSEGKQIKSNRKPSSICANQYNILIGYEHIEEFTLVKICAVSTQPPFVESIKFSCPFLHKIVRMSFAAETMAVCVVVQVKENDKHDFSVPIQSDFMKEKGQEKVVKQNIKNHKLKPGKIFPIIFNLLLYDTLVETLRSPIQTVLNSMLLIKKITDIAILPTKKLIIVLSDEKKIKAIKYEHVSSISFDRMLAWEMSFNVNDFPTCLDVHPLTFVVAVGFKEGIKLFTIFADGIKPNNIHFPLKNCESIRYAKFGHLLAAGSSHSILLINPYENRILHNIQLSYGYTTKELFFIDKDMYLLGQFGNGSSQVLDLDGGKVFEVWNKSSKLVCSTYDPVFDIMAMSYEDNEVKFYRQKGQIQFSFMWTYPFVVTKMLIINELGTAFFGTSSGKIRAYQWPFTDPIKFNKSFTEIQLHRSAITQLKIVHDFSYLVSGSEDGSIFISKITPYSDGMVVNDSSILHTFKANKKNYTSLYYLQNYLCTNNGMQLEKEERIAQFQSDKADFDSEYVCIIQDLQGEIDTKLKEEEKKRKENIKSILNPFDDRIQELNVRKNVLRQQLSVFMNKWKNETDTMEETKLVRMRQLYTESDELKNKLESLKYKNKEELKNKVQEMKRQSEGKQKQLRLEEAKINEACLKIQKEYNQSLINYKQLLKQEEEEGGIFKEKMMEQLENQFAVIKHKVQEQRKNYNKTNHQLRKEQDKIKYFQQLIGEVQVDIEKGKTKKEYLTKQMQQLFVLLSQKDQQIFDEEKAVKELLKKSINNYTHEEYLKHRQDELIQKEKYLQKQIQGLDEQYRVFQENFVQASKQTNDYNSKINKCQSTLQSLKEKQRKLKELKYSNNYRDHQSYSSVLECYHKCYSKQIFADEVSKILTLSENQGKQKQQKTQVKIDKRDHLINQVVNTNKLRKIDDTIRKTIMIKLNRETVNLTSQVNELRKEKKNLLAKMKEVQLMMKDIKQYLVENNLKENANQSIGEIVPGNISAIRSSPSNYNAPKLLPFQLYHQNKSTVRTSGHEKIIAKSIAEENSTQLPSIIKNSNSYSGSIIQQSSLVGVQQFTDQIAQQ